MWLLVAIVLLLILIYWYTYPAFGGLLYKLNQNVGLLRGKLRQKASESGMLAYVDNSHSMDFNRPLLLLLHGFGADKSVWFPLVRFLTNRYRVVIPDLLGHGDSAKSTRCSYSVEAQAQQLVALIRTLGEQQVHLIGNSMGGHIAAYMGIHYPELVSSVALICPAGVKSPIPSGLDQQLLSGNNPFLISDRAEFYPFYEMTMSRPPYTPKAVKDALAQAYIDDQAHLATVFAQYQESGLLDVQELATMQCPVFVLWGAQDNMVDVSAAAVWEKATNGSLEVFNDVGHMPMLEVPKRTFYVLEQFYNKL